MEWTTSNIFDLIKELVITTPVLEMFTAKDESRQESDVSKTAILVAFSQLQGDKLVLTAYHSKKLA